MMSQKKPLKNHNSNQLLIPGHLLRVLIKGSSGSGKTN